MEKNKIQEWLDQHTLYFRGYDIKNGPYPLPASIGEGFKFQYENPNTKQMEDFIAEADRNKEGKRILQFEITTFAGLCPGACHYFCKARSFIRCHEIGNPSHFVGGYLGVEIPQESNILEFSLGIPVTDEMIEEDKGHYEYHEVGDLGQALRNKDAFFPIIEELKSIFDMNEWTFEILDRT